jgi:hypothetical protein
MMAAVGAAAAPGTDEEAAAEEEPVAEEPVEDPDALSSLDADSEPEEEAGVVTEAEPEAEVSVGRVATEVVWRELPLLDAASALLEAAVVVASEEEAEVVEADTTRVVEAAWGALPSVAGLMNLGE